MPGAEGTLGEMDAKELLHSWNVPVNTGHLASTPEEAARAAEALRFPVAVKIVSPDVVHKSDVGGVALGLGSAAAVGEAAAAMMANVRRHLPAARIEGFLVQEQVPPGVELLVGARRDEQFGMMLVVGAGGVLAELVADVATTPAPVSARRARSMLAGLRIAPLLQGARGRRAADIEAACEAIARFSELVHAGSASIAEMEINPFVVLERGCVAVDARAKLSPVDSGGIA